MLTKIKVYEYDCMLYSENLQKNHPPKMFQPGGACPTLRSWIRLWIMSKFQHLTLSLKT